MKLTYMKLKNEVGVENFKNIEKMIKIIIKASKVSERNMNKSSSNVKKFMKSLKLKIVSLKILSDREKSI